MTRRRSVLSIVVGAGLVVGIGALILRKKAGEPKAATSSDVTTSSLALPVYPIKYTAQALQLAAIPDQRNPVMLCSYIPFAALEAHDEPAARRLLERLRVEHETAPEDLYGLRGRRQIVRLVKRYFDPKTFVELPPDILYESNQKFSVPTSPDAGTPCG